MISQNVKSNLISLYFLMRNYFILYKREDKLFKNKIVLFLNIFIRFLFLLAFILIFYQSFEQYDVIVNSFNAKYNEKSIDYKIIYYFWNEFFFVFVVFLIFTYLGIFLDFFKMFSYSEIRSVNLSLLQIMPLSSKMEMLFLTGVFVFKRMVFPTLTFLPVSLILLLFGYSLPLMYFIFIFALIIFSIASCWLVFSIASFMKSLSKSLFVIFLCLITIVLYEYVFLSAFLKNFVDVSEKIKPDELINIIELKFFVFSLIFFITSLLFLALALFLISSRFTKIKEFLVYKKQTSKNDFIFCFYFRNNTFNLFVLFWKSIVRDKSFIINFILLLLVQLFFIFKDFLLGHDAKLSAVFYFLLLSLPLSFQSNLLIHIYAFSKNILLTTPYHWKDLSIKIHYFALIPTIFLLFFLMLLGVMINGLKMSVLLIVILCLIFNQKFYYLTSDQLSCSGEKEEINRVVSLKKKTIAFITQIFFYLMLFCYVSLF